jgi:hypothetical protein
MPVAGTSVGVSHLEAYRHIESFIDRASRRVSSGGMIVVPFIPLECADEAPMRI